MRRGSHRDSGMAGPGALSSSLLPWAKEIYPRECFEELIKCVSEFICGTRGSPVPQQSCVALLELAPCTSSCASRKAEIQSDAQSEKPLGRNREALGTPRGKTPPVTRKGNWLKPM